MADTVEVVVGVVGRAHGVRGEVSVEARTDEPERRFAPGRLVRAEGTTRTFTVLAARHRTDRLLVRLREVTDRTSAEALRGLRLVADVDPYERPADEAEFYDRHLVGLRVLDAAGSQVGLVSAVLHRPGQDLLEVAAGEALHLVPFVTALVPEVDLAAGYLRLAGVRGLLDDPADEDG